MKRIEKVKDVEEEKRMERRTHYETKNLGKEVRSGRKKEKRRGGRMESGW